MAGYLAVGVIRLPSHNLHGHVSRLQPQSQAQSPHTLKLSSLLRPLTHEPCQKSSENEDRRGVVKIPSYLSSMTIGQTIQDPIEGGIISLQSSRALFDFFLLQLNAKWEYILDSRVDTHDNIRQRSPLLFATILFCSSKFANAVNAGLESAPDPLLQTGLCSLAQNLVVKSLAEGDRTIETMQALYLLVCWKDADDDISYLHTGYAFRVLHDMEPEQKGEYELQAARRRRTWLALFRRDRQQSLFFMRRPSLSQADEESFLLDNPDTWQRMRYAMPSDMLACCNADLRQVQGKLRALLQRASAEMLPCLVYMMEMDMNGWKSKWKKHLEASDRDPLLYPDQHHLDTLVHVWDHSVRLNIASGMLRQALLSSEPGYGTSLSSPLADRSDKMALEPWYSAAGLGTKLVTLIRTQQRLSPPVVVESGQNFLASRPWVSIEDKTCSVCAWMSSLRLSELSRSASKLYPSSVSIFSRRSAYILGIHSEVVSPPRN
ncbi:hypothetical protein BDW67DRAFT_188192 [Aspergillus spinulosporus]